MSESQHQIALFEWAAVAVCFHPELRLLYANANGGHRNIVTATRMKAEGVKPGVPDICLPVARGPFHSLYIELKVPKEPGSTKRAGRLSMAQQEWGRMLLNEGNAWEVCFGWEDARQVIENYLLIGKQ